MPTDVHEKLVELGFSEYEAKAYVALLRQNPDTGYQLSRLSGVPRSMIYEVLDKLIARGAAMRMRSGGAVKYAPVPATEFLDHLQREHEGLVEGLKGELTTFARQPNLDYVWNVEGYENILARAIEMIEQAKLRVYAALLPDTFEALRAAFESTLQRRVHVVLYSPSALDLPGAHVVVAPLSDSDISQSDRLGLVLAVDGEEVLIAEWPTQTEARGAWTSSRLLVFVTEHHLRTDLYLPRVLALLGDRALDLILEEDRELFAHALESHIGDPGL